MDRGNANIDRNTGVIDGNQVILQRNRMMLISMFTNVGLQLEIHTVFQ